MSVTGENERRALLRDKTRGMILIRKHKKKILMLLNSEIKKKNFDESGETALSLSCAVSLMQEYEHTNKRKRTHQRSKKSPLFAQINIQIEAKQ